MSEPQTAEQIARDEERWEEFARERYDLDDAELAMFRRRWHASSLADSRAVYLAALQSERERTRAENADLRARLEAAEGKITALESALEHHRWCRSCAEDGCGDCHECKEMTAALANKETPE